MLPDLDSDRADRPSRRRPRRGVRRTRAAGALIPLLLACAVASGDDAVQFLGATWYADGSCSLSVGGRPSVGRTAIDADFDEIGARTLVHCDTEDGRRVTILSRGGEALALGERVPLLAPHEIDAGLDGSIAWLALPGEGFADESAPRRFVRQGKVIIRSTPVTLAAGAAPHADKQPFAELTGRVGPAPPGASTAPPPAPNRAADAAR